MSERDGYEPGVPCWVDQSSTRPEEAGRFYAGLFGWETEEQMPADAPGNYLMCRLRGRNVAALGSQQDESAPAAWNTYVWVESADDVAAKVEQAGGRVLVAPMDVFDAGRTAYCLDPAGAPFGLWQPGRHRGAQLANEPGAFTWNELSTPDVEGATRFYGEVFGWRFTTAEFGDMPYTLVHVTEPREDTSMAGMMPARDGGQPPFWMVYFQVADTDESVRTAEGQGATIHERGFDTPAGRMAVIQDPTGAVFAIIRPPGS